MGMDVFGRAPTDERGEYFRASIWSWGPIHALLGELCSDLFNQETYIAMAFNDGNGVDDPGVCETIARRFEKWFAGFVGSAYVRESNVRVDGCGRFLSEEQLASMSPDAHRSAFRIEREHLEKWIAFVKHSGGFEVW